MADSYGIICFEDITDFAEAEGWRNPMQLLGGIAICIAINYFFNGFCEMARLLVTLEECLEALCILLGTQGRSLAAPVASGVSRGGRGAATVRYHCVDAECLGILGILEHDMGSH